MILEIWLSNGFLFLSVVQTEVKRHLVDSMQYLQDLPQQIEKQDIFNFKHPECRVQNFACGLNEINKYAREIQ